MPGLCLHLNFCHIQYLYGWTTDVQSLKNFGVSELEFFELVSTIIRGGGFHHIFPLSGSRSRTGGVASSQRDDDVCTTAHEGARQQWGSDAHTRDGTGWVLLAAGPAA